MLRQLVWDLSFKGDAKAIKRMDGAVDDISKSADKAGRSLSKNATKGSQAFANAGKNIAKSLVKVGIAGGVALGALATKSVFAASEVEEMSAKFDTVFGELAGSTKQWANDTAVAMGRSKYAFQGYLANLQNSLVGMGMTREAGADLSKQIVTLGVDLASFNNLAEDDAINSLTSAISGNHEASKALGAVLNESTLAMAMERDQIQGKFKDLTEAEKMQVRYNAIMMQSEDSIGDAVRTSGSFANQMKALKASTSDMTAELGAAFLPAATKVVGFLNKNMPAIKNGIETAFAAVGKGIDVFKTLADMVMFVGDNIASFTPLLISLGTALGVVLVPSLIASATATWALAAPILATMAPILAIGAAVTALGFIWKKYGEDIKEFAIKSFEMVRIKFTQIGSFFLSIGSRLAGLLKSMIDKFVGVILKFHPLALFMKALNAVSEFLFGFSLLDAGKNIIRGLIDGLGSMMGKVKDKVSEIAGTIGNGIKGFFGINSPAKLTTEYGLNITQGLEKGMDKGESGLRSVTEATNQTLSPAPVSNSSNFSPTLNIKIEGNSSPQDSVRVLKQEWEKLMAQYKRRTSIQGV